MVAHEEDVALSSTPVEIDEEVDYLYRGWPAIDVVTQENEHVRIREADGVEQSRERVKTAVDVSHSDFARSGAEAGHSGMARVYAGYPRKP